MLEKGLIQVYTSKSHQMNFAPIGLSLRAAGQDLRTLNMSFTPHELMEGASTASSLLKPNLIIEHFYFEQTSPDEKEINSTSDQIVEAFQRSKEAVFSGDYDIVILNGIHQVLNRGLLPLEDILSLMDEKPGNVELVLTGPKASQQIVDRADLVTELVVSDNPKRSPQQKNGRGDLGTIEVITGKGKGKTTYCLGKGVLMSSLGIPTLILQFIKSPRSYGEVKAIEKLPYMEIKTMGEGFLNKQKVAPRKKHLEAARRAWEECLREIFSLKYGLIILDEINIATHYGLVHPERVLEMLFLKPQDLHLILSGQNAHPKLTEAATSVLEMREIKHPFKKGIKARKGIEF